MRCYLCGQAVPKVHWNHPLALTLDHVIPRVLGGPDTAANLRVAHRACNRAKWDSLVA